MISGFLITHIIFDEMDKGKFSFAGFFGRRIRRIFPALALVMASSLVAGWYLLFPDQYEQLGRHIAGGAFFVVNFLLVAEAGYFDAAAETKAMLHLWSLAVEEQFYIIWPLLIWLAFKFRFSRFALLCCIALASFCLNIKFVSTEPEATFFYPFGRFWELLCGSFLAWVFLYRRDWISHLCSETEDDSKARVTANTVGALGLLFLIASVLIIDTEKSFPGYWAVLPVSGAMLIIASGPHAFTTRIFFMNPVAIWFGLISYPLYLLHWPLLTFLRSSSAKEISLVSVAIAIVLSIALAWVTYQAIEKPIRFPAKRRSKTLGLVICLFALGFAGLAVKEAEGLADRKLRNGFTMGDLADVTSINYGLDRACTPDETFQDQRCSSAHRPNVLLWGDSYAMHLAPVLEHSTTPIAFRQQTKSACRPILDFATNSAKYNQAWGEDCIALNNSVIDWVAQNDSIEYVIMASPFTYTKMVLVDGKIVPGTDEIMVDKIRKTIERLVALGKKPVLVGPPPRSGFDIGECWRRNFLRSSLDACDFEPNTSTRSAYALLEQLEGEAPVLKLSDFICSENGPCDATINGKSLYRDSGHLSNEGAAELGRTHDVGGKILDLADAVRP
ncbi:MAG: acyltransferase family protein [Pseudomonadota bacterium]